MFAAKKLGLKESPPAYLSLAQGTTPLVVTALAEGVSYASAGAGILDSTVSLRSTHLNNRSASRACHYYP
jgi:hypothetical protein